MSGGEEMSVKSLSQGLDVYLAQPGLLQPSDPEAKSLSLDHNAKLKRYQAFIIINRVL